MSPTPTTPAEISDLELPAEAMIGRLREHMSHVATAIDGDVDAPQTYVAVHALAALATTEAIADRLRESRWRTAQVALVYGAVVWQVAAAMGIDQYDLWRGLDVWSHRLLSAGQMSEAERDQLHDLFHRRNVR